MEKQLGNCEALVLLAALISIQMARSLTQEQLELLSDFFEALGENLALLALCPGGAAEQ